MNNEELKNIYDEYYILELEMDEIFKVRDVLSTVKREIRSLSIERFQRFEDLGKILLENIDELNFLDVSEKFNIHSRHLS